MVNWKKTMMASAGGGGGGWAAMSQQTDYEYLPQVGSMCVDNADYTYVSLYNAASGSEGGLVILDPDGNEQDFLVTGGTSDAQYGVDVCLGEDGKVYFTGWVNQNTYERDTWIFKANGGDAASNQFVFSLHRKIEANQNSSGNMTEPSRVNVSSGGKVIMTNYFNYQNASYNTYNGAFWSEGDDGGGYKERNYILRGDVTGNGRTYAYGLGIKSGWSHTSSSDYAWVTCRGPSAGGVIFRNRVDTASGYGYRLTNINIHAGGHNIAVDDTDAAYLLSRGTFSAPSIVTKLTASGTTVSQSWSKQYEFSELNIELNGQGNTYYDADNELIYVGGTANTSSSLESSLGVSSKYGFFVFAINKSGVFQHGTFFFSTDENLYFPGSSFEIASDGNIRAAGYGKNNDTGYNNTFVCSLPADGSLSGTFNQYRAVSLGSPTVTTSNVSLTTSNSSAGFAGSNVRDGGGVPTLTSGSLSWDLSTL